MVCGLLKKCLARQNKRVLFSFRPTFSSSWISKNYSTWMDGSLFVCMVVISVVEMVLVAWVFAKAILER